MSARPNRTSSLALLVCVVAGLIALCVAMPASAAGVSEPATQPTTTPATGLSGLLGGMVPSIAATPTTRPATLPATLLDKELIHRGERTARAPASQPAMSGHAAARPSSADYDITRVTLSLAAVIGLIFLARWASRKFFALPTTGATGVLQVVSRTPIAPKQQILLVRVGRRLMVIGDSAGRLTSLGEIADPDEVATLISQSQSAVEKRPVSLPFGSVFFGKLGSRRREEAADDWMEIDSDVAVGGERTELFGGVGSNDDNKTVMRRNDLVGETNVMPEAADTPTDPTEEAARAAVEAARQDIQALRDRLRSVTGRIGGAGEPAGG